MDVKALRTQPADAPYWAALDEGRFMLQQCQGCGGWRWPACWRCGQCGTWFPEWKDVPFEGVVYSWTTVHQPFGGTEALGLPYTTVLAALPQAGEHRILGLFQDDPAKLDFGTALKGSAHRVRFAGEEITGVRWTLA